MLIGPGNPAAGEHGKARERLLNLFRKQYEFIQVMDPLLKTIEFDERGAPAHWWPLGRREHIVVDPERAFGRPIDAISSVPTSIHAAAGRQRGPKLAAIAYAVPESSIRRAMKFEGAAGEKIAA
ncbi:MAG: hypothetical protein WCC64_16210 [Aliidongia sp.]